MAARLAQRAVAAPVQPDGAGVVSPVPAAAHPVAVPASRSSTRVLLFQLACITLALLQNSALTLCTRLSRGVRRERYLLASTVLAGEAIKLLVCLAALVHGSTSAGAPRLRWRDTPAFVTSLVCSRSGLLMALPGVLYLLQNQLSYYALAQLDAGSFAVLGQLKLLATAGFARVLLGKRLRAAQWLALCMLVAGVSIVQHAQGAAKAPRAAVATTPDSAAALADWVGLSLGLLTAVLSALLSGLAGVFVERMIKAPPKGVDAAAERQPTAAVVPASATASMWSRNIQLSVHALVFGLVQLLLFSSADEWSRLRSEGFFVGWSGLTVLVVCLSAVGGLLCALLVTHLDSVVKGYVNSGAILLTALAEQALVPGGGADWTRPDMMAGAAIVLASVAIYARQAPTAAPYAAPYASPHVAKRAVD